MSSQKIDHSSKIVFTIEVTGGMVSSGSILAHTGLSKAEWDGLSREKQDLLLDQALEEWLCNSVGSGWKIE